VGAVVLGVAALAAGIVALFTTDNGAGSVLLITLGMVLILVGLLGTRIELESLELLGAKMRVRQVVRSRLELAGSAPEADPQASLDTHADAVRRGLLRRQASTLQKLNGLYGLYEHTRSTQPPGRQRTEILDRLALRMQNLGGDVEFEPAEVSAWFHEGTDPLRVIALNLMLARCEYRDLLAVLSTIEKPHSLFEQYYGLRLAHKIVREIDDVERQLLADAIKRARRRRRVRRDEPIMNLSEKVLANLADLDVGV
jgi:hypothetical protein